MSNVLAALFASRRGFSAITAAPPPAQSVVTTVTVSPNTYSAVVGASKQFTATVKDQYGATMAGQTITWTSSDATNCPIDSTGTARPTAAGSYTITGTCAGVSDAATLSVSSTAATQVQNVRLEKASTGYSNYITWDAVAGSSKYRVLRDGVVYVVDIYAPGVTDPFAVSGQTYAYTVQSLVSGVYGPESSPLSVTTGPSSSPTPVERLALAPTAMTLRVGESFPITASTSEGANSRAVPALGNPTTFTSSHPGVTVSSAGLVTAESDPGAPVTITVTCGSQTATCAIAVQAAGTVVAPDIINANFEDGTFGGLSNPYGAYITIVPDPTPRASGKVSRIEYTNQTRGMSLNYGLWSGFGAGSSLYFRGKFYCAVDDPNRWDWGTNLYQRKLVYWFSCARNYPETLASKSYMTLNLKAPGLEYTLDQGLVGTQPGRVGFCYRADGTKFTLDRNTWHDLEWDVHFESVPGARDASIAVRVNGETLYPDPVHPEVWGPNMSLLETVHDRYNLFNVGDQLNGPADGVTEYRYWDDVRFSTHPIG